MIEFLEPLGFVALAALVVPLILHFVRRPEEREVRFAALRWIAERTRPRQRLRLTDYVLLVLRLLMVAVVGILLALPILRAKGLPGTQWVALAPGLDPRAARVALDAPNAEWHWLAPGFPEVGDGDSPKSDDPWSLLREIDADLPKNTGLVVIVPDILSDLDGGNIKLTRSVTWKVLDGRTPAPTSAPVEHRMISVRGDGQADGARVLVRALARAWKAQGMDVSLEEAAQDAPIQPGTDWLFWLGGDLSAAVHGWLMAGGTVIASRQSSDLGVTVLTTEGGDALLDFASVGRGRIFQFRSAMNAAADPVLRKPDFPHRLKSLLDDGLSPPDQASAAGLAPGTGSGAPSGPIQRLDSWLVLAAAVLFLIERLWATRRAWRVA